MGIPKYKRTRWHDEALLCFGLVRLVLCKILARWVYKVVFSNFSKVRVLDLGYCYLKKCSTRHGIGRDVRYASCDVSGQEIQNRISHIGQPNGIDEMCDMRKESQCSMQLRNVRCGLRKRLDIHVVLNYKVTDSVVACCPIKDTPNNGPNLNKLKNFIF